MAQYRNVTEFLAKIREAYNKAREEYTLLNDKLDKIEALRKRDIERGWANPQFQKEDTETYQKNKAEVKKQLSELINNTNAEYEKIKAECEAVFGEYDRATGKKVDLATIELLKSGILRPDEIKALINDFDGNSAMLRIIGDYAYKRGKEEKNNDLATIGAQYINYHFPYKEHIDTLIMWGQKAMRDDRRLSDGIARIYDEQADKIFADAESIYITVDDNE
jgi:hypothetical protein